MGKSPESVKWDNKGVVSLDGETIPGSSITDLVNDVVRSRKGYSPRGKNSFAKVLAKMNTPEEFIRNEKRRKLISSLKMTPETLTSTPPSESLTWFPTPPTAPRKDARLREKGTTTAARKGRRGINWVSYD